MDKANFIKQAGIILIMVFIQIFGISEIYSEDGSLRQLRGKVIFADDKSPVGEGTIRIYMKSSGFENEVLIESTVINTNGEFTFSKPVQNTTDGIKIMCYPDDKEDNLPAFMAAEYQYFKSSAKAGNNYDVIIEVIRAGN